MLNFRTWSSRLIKKKKFVFSHDKEFTNTNHYTLGLLNSLIADDNNNRNEINLNYFNYIFGFNNDIPQANTNESPLKDYLLLSTSKDCMFLYGYYNDKEINLGMRNLLKNYFRYTLSSSTVAYQDILHIKLYADYTRYEYSFNSDAINCIIVGNRQGDIQVYDMEVVFYKDGKVGFNEKPLFIIDCGMRIVGMKMIDHFGGLNQGYVELFVLKLNRSFESFKIYRK